jgi:hypothetical protein
MAMLDINPEIVCDIIQKAREFQAKEGVTFPTDVPGEPSDDTDWLHTLADHKDDLTYQEVIQAINKLEPDQQMTLVALMYIGRGDYTPNEWSEAVAMARETQTPDKIAVYLLSQPLVSNYLEDALTAMGYSCE